MTRPADIRPSCTIDSTLVALSFTNANSAATNNPFRATRRSAAKSLSPEKTIPSKNPS